MSTKPKKNIGIVLSGGGAKGAFEVGALSVIQNWAKKKKYNISAISGTSIGSFNGAFTAAGQYDELKDMWLNWDKNSPINSMHWYGPYLSLLINGYMVEDGPLRALLRNKLDIESLKSSDVDYINTRVRLNDGELLLGGNRNSEPKPNHEYVNEILASMAFLPARKEIRVLGELCADGGFRECVPVKPLIDNTQHKLDHLFVVLLDPAKRTWKYKDINNMDAITRFQWSHMDILWTETVYNDVKLGMTHWNKDDMFHVIQPDVIESDVGDFDRSSIHHLYEHGIEKTEQYIKLNKI